VKKNRSRQGYSGRDAGGFVALPWSVLDSAAYARLSHPARGLLLELCRQYVRDNNGRLLLSRAYLEPRGWKSTSVIDRAKKELLDVGFIHQTVQGHRPNKASWYALTFYSLDRIPGFDAGAAESFRRGAYRDAEPLPKPKPTREELYRKWDQKNAALNPSRGAERAAIAPSRGAERSSPAPSGGAIRAIFDPLSTPSEEHLLDMPSPVMVWNEEGSYQRLRRTPKNLFTGLMAMH
jgi:hypothetical protein